MKILVIDDEKSIRYSLKIGLETLGQKVFVAETGEEGLMIVERESMDLAIVDIKLPGMDGLEVLKQIKKLRPSCYVIMITYLSDVKLAVHAMKTGAYDYFTKPFSLVEITDSIKRTLEYIKVKEKLDMTMSGEHVSLIGNSEEVQKIKELIMNIGKVQYDTCILLEAESGAGKEMVARFIHHVKYGNKKPFVAINCAAIPKTLQESELFGYEKGSFSDAKSDKEGLIEKANHGVLFLDEIGDMDMELQAKMLRVLQEKKFRRIGSLREIEYSATIIAATNKAIQQEIMDGNFRKDLYYRLNIIPIKIPPLRDRREDIPLLVDHFVNFYNQRLSKNVCSIAMEAMEAFIKYNWYGNVRELKNIVERIMFFKNGEQIELEDLPDDIVSCAPEKGYTSIEEAEGKIIERALAKNFWNITKTANELDMSRLTLRRKIEKYSIEKGRKI